MAWSSDEIAQVRAAIMKLVTGERVASVSYAGPPARSVNYHPVDLPDLRKLLADMESSVSTTPSYRLAATRKGV